MKKIITPILILAFITASGWMLRDTWAGLASNQTISRAALQDGINSLSLSRAGAVVPSDSERNITKSEVANYIYLDPNNAGYAARAANQLVIKSDITPLNDSTQLWSNSGNLTSATSTCSAGANGTSFEAHYVAPLAVNSYMATFPYQGDARPQYFYNSANNSAYKWNASSKIDSIVGCPAPPANITLTFTYVKLPYQMVVSTSGILASAINSIGGITCNGYGTSSCTTVLETSTAAVGSNSLPKGSNGSYYMVVGSELSGTSSYYHFVNSVTINGTTYVSGNSFTLGSQTITISIVTVCTLITT